MNLNKSESMCDVKTLYYKIIEIKKRGFNHLADDYFDWPESQGSAQMDIMLSLKTNNN